MAVKTERERERETVVSSVSQLAWTCCYLSMMLITVNLDWVQLPRAEIGNTRMLLPCVSVCVWCLST